MSGSYTLANPFWQPLPSPCLIIELHKQQGHARSHCQAAALDTEGREEAKGSEQDRGVRSGAEP